ncbi:MAG: outer membrane lipoprotein-sorting protein [Gallionellaceae bacterium]
MMRVGIFALALFSSIAFAEPAAISAQEIAESMSRAKYSNGFEVRMNVFVTKANGAHPLPMKLAIIGKMAADKQRLSIRGITPKAIRGHFVAAERIGGVRAIKFQTTNNSSELDPNTQLFDSGLVIWDMFSPWWGWSKQILEGRERINKHDCERIRSRTNDLRSAVREVESCVDIQNKISLRTRLYDSQHVLLRTTSVQSFMRKSQGLLAAKKLTIVGADQSKTEIRIYSGDEEYQVTAETFAALEHQSRDDQREVR